MAKDSGYPQVPAGNEQVDFVWGNAPLQPNTDRTETGAPVVAVAANASQNNGWSGYSVYPSGQLDPALDNHVIAVTGYNGFPGFGASTGATGSTGGATGSTGSTATTYSVSLVNGFVAPDSTFLATTDMYGNPDQAVNSYVVDYYGIQGVGYGRTYQGATLYLTVRVPENSAFATRANFFSAQLGSYLTNFPWMESIYSIGYSNDLPLSRYKDYMDAAIASTGIPFNIDFSGMTLSDSYGNSMDTYSSQYWLETFTGGSATGNNLTVANAWNMSHPLSYLTLGNYETWENNSSISNPISVSTYNGATTVTFILSVPAEHSSMYAAYSPDVESSALLVGSGTGMYGGTVYADLTSYKNTAYIYGPEINFNGQLEITL